MKCRKCKTYFCPPVLWRWWGGDWLAPLLWFGVCWSASFVYALTSGSGRLIWWKRKSSNRVTNQQRWVLLPDTVFTPLPSFENGFLSVLLIRFLPLHTGSGILCSWWWTEDNGSTDAEKMMRKETSRSNCCPIAATDQRLHSADWKRGRQLWQSWTKVWAASLVLLQCWRQCR